MSLDGLIHRRHPSNWELFLSSPLKYLARKIFAISTFRCQPILNANSVRVICISDTHNVHKSLPAVPSGDLLIHAGDLSNSGTKEEIHATLDWLQSHPHLHKIFIAGNHDCLFDEISSRVVVKAAYPDLIYLQDSSVSIDVRGRTLNIHGSPQTPRNGSWPFQYPRISTTQVSSSDIWAKIPENTDILVTHGPPAHHLALEYGCLALLDAIWRIRPKLHVFGHIHAGRGTETINWTKGQRKYERIAGGDGGWWDLLVLVIRTTPVLWKKRLDNKSHRTVLVNAASVGGFRDEKRNHAIVIDI